MNWIDRMLKKIPVLAALGFTGGVAIALAVIAAADEYREYRRSLLPEPGTFRSPSGTEIRLVLTESNLGGDEVEIGEITFPPGTNSGDHLHGTTEVFYILEGELEHVVDGVSETLGPGDLGFVRPPSEVNHITAPDGPPVRALVIWAPGGEGTRIVRNWTPR